MKWSHLLVFFLVLALGTGVGGVVAAEEGDDVQQLAGQLVDHTEPEMRAAGFLTIAHAGSAEQRGELEEYRARAGQQERLAVGASSIIAGDAEGTTFTADQVAESSDPVAALRELSVYLTDDQLAEVVDAAVDEASSSVRDQIFRFQGSRIGPVYDSLTDRLTSDDEDVRDAALEVVVETGGKPALEAAASLSGHRTTDIRRQVLDITEAVSGPSELHDDVVELLEEASRDADEELQGRAARQLVELGEQRGTDVLVDRLAGQEPEQRVDNLEFLVEHDIETDRDNIDPMIDEIEQGGVDDEREREWQLLYELAATDADAALVGDLQSKLDSTDFEDRLAAFRALGRTGHRDVLGNLTDGLGEGRSDVRRLSARGLGHLALADALPELRSALTSESDPEVRLELVEAVGKIRDSRSVDVLRFMVRDDDPEVRMAVVDALAEIGLPETAQALEILVQDRNNDIKWNAFLALLEIDPDRAQRRAGMALRNLPSGYTDDIDPYGLSDDARELLYREVVSNSASRIYGPAVTQVVAYRDVLLPVARDLVGDDDLRDGARADLVHLLISLGEDEDLARLEQITADYPDDLSGQMAGWYLAGQGNDAFAETFEELAEHEGDEDRTVMNVIANLALANMD